MNQWQQYRQMVHVHVANNSPCDYDIRLHCMRISINDNIATCGSQMLQVLSLQYITS